MTSHQTDRNGRYLALFLLIVTILLWGYSFISTKIILAEIPPATIAFYRQIIAVVTLLPLVMISLLRGGLARLAHVTWRDAGLVAVSALFGIVLNFVFENNGMRLTTASDASMIVAAVPIFTLFTEALFFKLRITSKLVACLIVSVIGVYLVITGGRHLDLFSAHTIGNLLVLAAMACWVVYTILNKKLTDKYSSLLLTFSQAAFAIFIFVPFILPETGQWRMPTATSLIHLFYLGICGSALGYILFVHAVKQLGATISSAFLNLIPVVTVVCGYFILGEKVSWPQLAGMSLIMVSLFAISTARPRAKQAYTEEGASAGIT